jgi:ADP-ribose pyrophosphatase YjhB (NUDIX family)
MDNFFNDIKRLKNIADVGLLYAKDPYDRERYEELHSISLSMMARLTDTPLSKLTDFYLETTDYPTPKVDIRAFVMDENDDFLMVRESTDGGWSLPGGWADIGLSPREVAVKEVLEETGLRVEAEHLMAVFDKKCHPHPPQAGYVYKIVIACRMVDYPQTEQKGFDILDVGWFSIYNLPPLSTHRIVESQLLLLHNQFKGHDPMPYFD